MHKDGTYLVNYIQNNPQDRDMNTKKKLIQDYIGEHNMQNKENIKMQQQNENIDNNDDKPIFEEDAIIMSGDIGKGSCKFYYKYQKEGKDVYKKFKFDSKACLYDDVSFDSNEPFIVDGIKYSVSESAPPIYGGPSKNHAGISKEHPLHRILLLKGMYEIQKKILQDTGKLYNKFSVVTGSSLDSHQKDHGSGVYLNVMDMPLTEEELNECENDYELKIKAKIDKATRLSDNYHSKKFSIEYGIDEFDLIIDDLIVSPETLTGASTVPNITLDHTFFIDIGELNKSAFPVLNGNQKKAYTDTEGTVNIINDATNVLNSKMDDTAITNGTEKLDADFVKLVINKGTKNTTIDKLLKDYFFQYIDDLIITLCNYKPARFSREYSQLVFLGGGSKLIEKYIELYYQETLNTEKELSNKPIIAKYSEFANSLGMLNKGLSEFKIRRVKRERLKRNTANKQ